jgi:hypothetical protein
MAIPGRFEPIGQRSDLSANLRLRYGSDAHDPKSFVLTLTPQYVARALGDAHPITFVELEKYAYDNAGDLRAEAVKGKDSGFTTLTLD